MSGTGLSSSVTRPAIGTSAELRPQPAMSGKNPRTKEPKNQKAIAHWLLDPLVLRFFGSSVIRPLRCRDCGAVADGGELIHGGPRGVFSREADGAVAVQKVAAGGMQAAGPGPTS